MASTVHHEVLLRISEIYSISDDSYLLIYKWRMAHTQGAQFVHVL